MKMQAKIYFALLILCALHTQVIRNSSEARTKELSKLHIRKKRLLNRTPHEIPVSILEVPYIVNIEEEGISQCAGSILTAHIVITAAHCVHRNIRKYTILSGSGLIDRGLRHKIVRKIIYTDSGILPHDLALVIIFPPILIEHAVNERITLYNGEVPPGTLATLTGWGCTRIIGNFYIRPSELRSIAVPVISLKECEEICRYHTIITDRNICTYDKCGEKAGSFGDSGGPLVINRQLVGVYSASKSRSTPEYPDVYVNLAHLPYRKWIMENLHHVGA